MTPWWSFNPSHHEYVASSASSVRGISGSKPEFYVYAGANIKYRFYSSLLQGQFRDSIHTLGYSQIEQAIASATVGTTREFGDNLCFSLLVRGTTPEIKGPNARNLWWFVTVVTMPYASYSCLHLKVFNVVPIKRKSTMHRALQLKSRHVCLSMR